MENLRRLAITIARARAEREEADKLADKLLELASLQPSGVMPAITERLGKPKELPQTFVVQLVQRLREQHPSVMPVMDWIEQLAKQGTSIEQIIHAEHQRQAAAQVTVGNIITSMRLLSTLDWNDFFEKVSLIEPLLEEIRRASIRGWSLPRAIATGTSSNASASEREQANSKSRKQPSSSRRKQRKSLAEKTRRLFPHRRRFNSSRKQLWLSTDQANVCVAFCCDIRPGRLGTLIFLTLLVISLLLYTMYARRRLAVAGCDRTTRADSRERSGPDSAQLGSHTLLSATFAAAWIPPKVFLLKRRRS